MAGVLRVRGVGDTVLQEIGIWASIVAAVFAVLAVAVPIAFRWRDSRSRLEIDYYLGDAPPRAWVAEGRISLTTPRHPMAVFRVENVGVRSESLSDAYIAVPGADDLHPFSGGNPPMPSPLHPGFPCVFHQSLQGVCGELVKRGCTGTARVDLVIRLGRGALHKERIEIPDVEAEAEGR